MTTQLKDRTCWGMKNIKTAFTDGVEIIYSKTSLIQTNWERTHVKISEGTNYRSLILTDGKNTTETLKWQ
jgi:hypothetical protein